MAPKAGNEEQPGKCANRAVVHVHAHPKEKKPGIEFVCGHLAGHTDRFCGSVIEGSEPLVTVLWDNPNYIPER